MSEVSPTTSINVIFIVGRARSGTTLLQDLLDRHPGILFPIESRFALYLYKKYRGTHVITKTFIQHFLDDLYNEFMFRRHWNIKRSTLESALLTLEGTRIDFGTLCKIVYLQYRSIHEKGRICLLGDKNPTYTLFITQLLKIFPEARFIHLVRNPKDNVVSHRKIFKRSDLAFLAEGWRRYNRAAEKQKAKYAEKFLTIRYEDLVTNTAGVLQKVGAHIGVDLSHVLEAPSHTNTPEKNEWLNTKAFQHFHKNLFDPIGSQQIDKWKKELSASEATLVELITGPLATRYGYLTSQIPISASHLIKALLAKIKYGCYDRALEAYYASPFFMRKLSHRFSATMHREFGLVTYFNFGEYAFKETSQ